jgi:hypothetical protein
MESASTSFDAKITEFGDWRGKALARVREIIHDADPQIVEERKWVKPNRRVFPSFPAAVSSVRERHTRTPLS